MKGRTTKRGQKKLKRVAYRFITPESEVGTLLYAMLRQLVHAHHPDIVSARIALAWNLTWQPDVDGRVTLGQCRKVSDLDRELSDGLYDFVIVLRREFWEHPLVTDDQRRALLDHELCHAAVKRDEAGEPVVDERGRTAYRIRKHDLEEFVVIAERHGCWKKDLEQFGRALERAHAKASRGWIGYTSLQEQLAHVGASVPLETIIGWTDAERREAATWVLVQEDLRIVPMPAFLATACALVPSDPLPPIPSPDIPEAASSVSR